MYPDNPFLQLIPKRIARLHRDLKASIWLPAEAELEIEASEVVDAHLSFAEAQELDYERVRPPFNWGRDFCQRWFRLQWSVDEQERPLWLEWADQGESTLYFSECPATGFDPAHTHAELPQTCGCGWMRVLAVHAQAWPAECNVRNADGTYRFTGGRLVYRDDLAFKLFYDTELFLDILQWEFRKYAPKDAPFPGGIGHLPPLERTSPFYRRLARRLDDAVSVFEREGLQALETAYTDIYNWLRTEESDFRVQLTGHGHIDLVWLWTEAAGRGKVAHTFTNVLHLMKQYPEFHFGFSQSAAFRALEKTEPALFDAVLERMKEGRFEANGGSEVEFDTQLPCGEALARDLMLGQQYFRRLPNASPQVFWLPDTFGYSGCVPQLLKEVGIRYFFTTKLTWGTVSPFPYSSFCWEGVDGSQVLAHVTQGGGYNAMVRVAELKGAEENYRQADVHDAVLLPTGYGDGGGGPAVEHCERAKRLQNIRGLPSVSWGRIDRFYEELEQLSARLPVYKGELFLQYHRGVHTTHGDLKLANRRLECALREWEAVRVATAGDVIPSEFWERASFTHFHDYIPGSSIPQVYADGVPELKDLARRAQHAAKAELESDAGEACLFNPLPMPLRHCLEDGQSVVLPPLTGVPIAQVVREESEPLSAEGLVLDNGIVRAVLKEDGRIESLTVNGRSLAWRAPSAELMAFPDRPHLFPAWDIDRSTLSNGYGLSGLTAHVESAVLPASAYCRFETQVTRNTRILCTYSLRPGESVLRITYSVELGDRDLLLKTVFHTDYNGRQARFGAPFGSTLRSQYPGLPTDEAQWEVPGSRWAAIADDAELEGLFLCAEAKYGFNCRAGLLGLSLVRSAETPMPYSGMNGGYREPHDLSAKDAYSDMGTHTIELAIGLFEASAPLDAQPAALAETLFSAPVHYDGKAVSSPVSGLSAPGSLVPVWCKPAEDGRGFILRLHEVLGCRGDAQLQLREGARAERVNIMEEPLDKPMSADGRFSFSPYEIISVRLQTP